MEVNMGRDMTPIKPLRGRASTKSHHNRPSHDVAVRAFASKAGRGKALMLYAAEMIKNKRIVRPEDLERLVDSGDFGRYLDAKARPIVEKREIFASVANPNWTPPKPEESKPQSNDYAAAMAETRELQESYALKHDADAALAFCFENRCPAKYEETLARITADRHRLAALKAWKQKNKGS